MVNAVADVYRPFPPDQQKLGGLIGSRLRANSEGFLERINVASVDAATENAGVLLDAAVYSFEHNRDPKLNGIVNQLARKLIASLHSAAGAESDLGQTAAEEIIPAESANLRALLNYYRLSGDQSALAAAANIGNQLLEQRHSSTRPETLGVAIEPMVHLYRFTDQGKYLDFCTSVADEWIKKTPPQKPFTYRSLLALNGLVELYRINGDNAVYKVPLQAWTEIRASRFSLTGVPMSAMEAQDTAPDACTTGAWLQLSLNLLRISGQAVYSEQLERMIYNQVFAGQDGRTGAILAPVAWAGKKQPANSAACAANEARALAEIPSVVWGRYGTGVAINLYTNSRTTVRLRLRGTMQLITETNYPETGTVTIHVDPDHPLHVPLRLRVPEWATKFVADVGQNHLEGKPGDFMTLNRNWKKGDTVNIRVPLETRVIPGVGVFTGDVAIARGPQVLALGKTFNPQLADLRQASVAPTGLTVSMNQLATNFAAEWMGDQAYVIEGSYAGEPRKLVLVPFADARDYRVWLAQSKASSGASER